MTKINLPALPSLPGSSRTGRLSACFCGCGGTTQATFMPGHDSVLKAWVIRVERGVVALTELNDFPGLKRRVAEVVKARSEGKNPTFMRNVELPEGATKARRGGKKADAVAETVTETPIEGTGTEG